ncbi:methyl-accepting chemotaxis protein [Marinomonas sp. THO17]|uniref:methyl-accepting chemotaxis protein n=1 Tax=Marinomonas sp. THO17 TaxID=3149048 RepID=UPI00336BFDEC
MLLKPGTILIAALPYYARIAIMLLLGLVCISALYWSFLQPQANTLILIGTGLLMYFAMSANYLTRQRIRELNHHLKDFDTDQVLELSYNDKEFNQLASKINSLLRNIHRKQHLLKSCSQETQYTANELHNSSNKVAHGAEQEHQALDSLVNESTKMSLAINDILTHVQSTLDTAHQTHRQSEEGQVALDNLRQQITSMHTTVTNNQTQMQELIETTEKIKNFVATIEQITSQINLLSLNAAIESARAGEAGRGFAVVANEVRELASRTEVAAQDIDLMVNSIASQVHTSEKTSLKLIDFANQASLGSEEASMALSEIYQAAQSTQSEVKQSLEGISEFQFTNNQMSERLKDIAEVSEQHSKASKDAKDMVKYLEWLSSRLDQKEALL